MSKHTLTREITKELEKLNDRIDRKIIKGEPFRDEARRHKDLLATMRLLAEEVEVPATETRRAHKLGKSPVRRTLGGSSFLRIFRLNFA